MLFFSLKSKNLLYGFFYLIIIFSSKIYCNENFDSAKIKCFNCHQDLKKLFSKQFIHSPVLKGNCEICHQPHGKSNKLILVDTVQKICSTCHRTNDDSTFIKNHYNINVNSLNCSTCHNPHASDKKNLILSFEHTPFENRECDACHDDDFDSLRINSNQNKICVKCHNVTNDLDSDYYHLPYLKGECFSCHDPHVSPNTYHLKLSVNQICVEECHKEKLKNGSKHKKNNLFDCFKCHEAHKSPQKYLLKIQGNNNLEKTKSLSIDTTKSDKTINLLFDSNTTNHYPINKF